MQILKFEFSDLSDCSAEKNSALKWTRNEPEMQWVKEFTTEQRNLDKAITMQILRFEISDLSDCLTEKDSMILLWNESETQWVKKFTIKQKNLDRAIIMQILRFEISDSSNCLAEKDSMILTKTVTWLIITWFYVWLSRKRK